jgi:hypothetical protein
MKKDVEYQAGQVDMMKSESSEYVKNQEMIAIIGIIKRDMMIYTDMQVKDNFKEMNFLVEEKLKLLDNVPTASDFVKRSDFKRFKEDH